MVRMGVPPVHTHADNSQGGQIDIDDVFSDLVHTHESAGEGGQIDHDAALSGVSGSDHHAAPRVMIHDAGSAAWVKPGWTGFSVGNETPSVDELYYTPIYVERSTTYTRIGIHVNGAGAGGTVARLGIYAATIDGDGQLVPDTLTLDAGTVSVATTGAKEITIAETLGEGYHFLAYSSDGAAQVKVPTGGNGWSAPISKASATINTAEGVIPSVTVVDGAAALPSPATTPDAQRHMQFSPVWLRL